MKQKIAIIIGAGPAGLTAAYELLQRTDIKPIIFEATSDIGGISKTVNYKGNRIDIGGHRFFSKSDRIMNWWQKILPVQGSTHFNTTGPDPEEENKVMLIRNRLSRIFYLRKFFDYPISLSLNTLRNLGLTRVMRVALSYLKIRLFPIRKEKSLEDFFINRFGRELYYTFFKEYTEKVWGVPCTGITSEWGVQRIKKLSIGKAVLHSLRRMVIEDRALGQKKTETSLIDQFLYPKFGPGQMWETVAQWIKKLGGEIRLDHKVIGLTLDGFRIVEVEVHDVKKNQVFKVPGDYFFSTMPVRDLILGIKGDTPPEVIEIAQGLIYRDFITVGVLLTKMTENGRLKSSSTEHVFPDNWLYIQEPDVKIGRVQIFNNWSPYMVKDPNHVWIGLEYFCNEGDELWSKSDSAFISFAIDELEQIGFIDKNDVLDSTIIRMPKTYPAYWGTYDRFNFIKDFTDKIENLFLIGRNGMHKYNNQDHSMLTAMVSVDNITNGLKSKSNIWSVNTEEKYHEYK